MMVLFEQLFRELVEAFRKVEEEREFAEFHRKIVEEWMR